MRLVSWNVNGLRAIFKKGFVSWLEVHRPELVAIQETKCSLAQLEADMLRPAGYRSWYFPAERPGYSGTALYSRINPIRVDHGLGVAEFDCEGRSLTAEFADFFVVGAYFPNAQGPGRRLDYKLRFCQTVQEYVEKLSSGGKPVFLCGDVNIAHQEIDLHNPAGSRRQAGFLPAEREWLTRLLESGHQDLFRQQHPEPEQYTWWSHLNDARGRNRGWRIDYFLASPGFDWAYRSRHYPEVLGSDHCPVELELI
ncbi:MAG: exodeoxyribonuclease III [Vulcanimicrobiota bacterium]